MQAVHRRRRLIVIGPPGAGETTLLRWLIQVGVNPVAQIWSPGAIRDDTGDEPWVWD